MVYMPHISEWWDTVSDTVKSTFLTLLHDVPSFSPVLILATAETPYSKMSEEVGDTVTLCVSHEALPQNKSRLFANTYFDKDFLVGFFCYIFKKKSFF